MSKRPHLHLSNKLGFDLRIGNDNRKQFGEMRHKDPNFVVNGRNHRGQGETLIAQFPVPKHVEQKGSNQRSQHLVVVVACVDECIAEGGYDNTANAIVDVGQVFLQLEITIS